MPLPTDMPFASCRPRVARRQLLVGTAAASATFFIGRNLRASEPEFVAKFASVAPDGTPWSKQLGDVKKRVADQSAGKIKLKNHLGGALGGEVETLERCKQGSIEGWGGTLGALSTKIPELGCFELPYLFPSVAAADQVIDALLPDLDALLWKHGLKLLFMSENGHRSIGTNFGFVHGAADLKGKKMRSQQSDVHLDTWRALGASPVPIAVPEVLTSLQTGGVDGFDNTELFTFAASWYQAITHFTLTRHSYQPGVVVLSRKFWERLPSALQTVMLGDPKAEAAAGRAGVRKLAPALRANFGNAGIAVYEPTAAEREAMAKATKSAHDKFRQKHRADGAKLLSAINKRL